MAMHQIDLLRKTWSKRRASNVSSQPQVKPSSQDRLCAPTASSSWGHQVTRIGHHIKTTLTDVARPRYTSNPPVPTTPDRISRTKSVLSAKFREFFGPEITEIYSPLPSPPVRPKVAAAAIRSRHGSDDSTASISYRTNSSSRTAKCFDSLASQDFADYMTRATFELNVQHQPPPGSHGPQESPGRSSHERRRERASTLKLLEGSRAGAVTTSKSLAASRRDRFMAACQTEKRPRRRQSEMSFADVGGVGGRMLDGCQVCGRLAYGTESLQYGRCGDCR